MATDMTTKALNLKSVEAMTGLKRSWIYQLEARGEFPKRRRFGARAVRWLESEVAEYINSRPKAE